MTPVMMGICRFDMEVGCWWGFPKAKTKNTSMHVLNSKHQQTRQGFLPSAARFDAARDPVPGLDGPQNKDGDPCQRPGGGKLTVVVVLECQNGDEIGVQWGTRWLSYTDLKS